MGLSRSLSRVVVFSMCTLAFCSITSAQDLCSVEDVIQPAIDEAASDGDCVTDGIYVSPEVFANRAADKCQNISDAGRCKSCIGSEFERAQLIFRALVKAKLIETSTIPNLKKTFDGLRKVLCPQAPTENPKPTPSPEPSASPGHGGNGEEPPATPPASNTPGNNLDSIRLQINQACPCNGFASHAKYMECVGNNLAKLVQNQTITRDAAYSIYNQNNLSSCSSSPAPGTSPGPAPSPTSGGDRR